MGRSTVHLVATTPISVFTSSNVLSSNISAASLESALERGEHGDAEGNQKNQHRMTRPLHRPLKPREALLCASNCNSSLVTMIVRKKPFLMSSLSRKTTNALSISG